MDWAKKIESMDGWVFGNTAEMADEIAQQTIDGLNRATCSLFEEDTLSKLGDQSYIKNSKGHPVCVIEIDDVTVKEFKNVNHEFANAEGFDSLDEWKSLHFEFFKSQKENFSESDLVICEYFKVIHIF